MDANKIYIDKQDDVMFSCFLQIPQGTRLQIKVEQAQYSFYLNEAGVKQIQQAKQTNSSLNIPSSLIIILWYYTCFNNAIKLKVPKVFNKYFHNSSIIFILNLSRLFLSKSLEKKISLQSGITFNSYYASEQSDLDFSRYSDIVLQSNVSFNGDIIHKIKSNLLQDTNCLQIVSAHYWLSEQVLSAFRTKLNLLVWEVASLVPAFFVVRDLSPIKGIPLSIFAWVGATIVFATIRSIIFNLFQRNTYINSKFLNWLAWGVTCLIPTIPTIVIQPINALWLLFWSAFAPLLTQRILSFILPQVGKLIMRRLLSS